MGEYGPDSPDNEGRQGIGSTGAAAVVHRRRSSADTFFVESPFLVSLSLPRDLSCLCQYPIAIAFGRGGKWPRIVIQGPSKLS